MIAFVTVGSTHFDVLIKRTLSEAVLGSLKSKGYSTLVIQYGRSTLFSAQLPPSSICGVNVEVWPFKPSLADELARADLVISHAGSGTIIEALSYRKPLIAVPNPTLQENHQTELATRLDLLGHLVAATVDNLPEAIQSLDISRLKPFPPPDGARFRVLLDEEMGYN